MVPLTGWSWGRLDRGPLWPLAGRARNFVLKRAKTKFKLHRSASQTDVLPTPRTARCDSLRRAKPPCDLLPSARALAARLVPAGDGEPAGLVQLLPTLGLLLPLHDRLFRAGAAHPRGDRVLPRWLRSPVGFARLPRRRPRREQRLVHGDDAAARRHSHVGRAAARPGVGSKQDRRAQLLGRPFDHAQCACVRPGRLSSWRRGRRRGLLQAEERFQLQRRRLAVGEWPFAHHHTLRRALRGRERAAGHRRRPRPRRAAARGGAPAGRARRPEAARAAQDGRRRARGRVAPAGRSAGERGKAARRRDHRRGLQPRPGRAAPARPRARLQLLPAGRARLAPADLAGGVGQVLAARHVGAPRVHTTPHRGGAEHPFR